jgi:hypothetical protein
MAAKEISVKKYVVRLSGERQRKIGWPVKFELTEQTRQAVDDYLRDANRKPANFCSRAVAGSAGPWGRANMRA